MPNIATALKEEIARVARKQNKNESQALKKASAQYRSDIAALKRRIGSLEVMIRKLGKGTLQSKASQSKGDGDRENSGNVRFSAKGLANHRTRLGLSAADMALLVGCSGQSIYKWEEGKSRPRAAQVASLVKVRKYGKREALAQLEILRTAK